MVKVNLITWDKSLTQHCPEVMQGARARRKGLGRAYEGGCVCCQDPQELGWAAGARLHFCFPPYLLFCRVLSPPVPPSV